MPNPLPWILGLALPACRFPGAQGIALPGPVDLGSDPRSSKPNQALAGPTGKHGQTVDLITPPFALTTAELAAAVRRALAFMPGTYLLADHPDHLLTHYVARSRLCNFPDLVTVQVGPGGWQGESFLTIWSRSLYGHYDFGANLRRLHDWIADITIETQSLTRKT